MSSFDRFFVYRPPTSIRFGTVALAQLTSLRSVVTKASVEPRVECHDPRWHFRKRNPERRRALPLRLPMRRIYRRPLIQRPCVKTSQDWTKDIYRRRL